MVTLSMMVYGVNNRFISMFRGSDLQQYLSNKQIDFNLFRTRFEQAKSNDCPFCTCIYKKYDVHLDKHNVNIHHNFFLKEELFNLSIYILISFLIVCLLFFVAYVLSPKRYLHDKSSPYECGFSPYSDARESMNINFYLFIVLFLIFDIEILFLLPFIFCIHNTMCLFVVHFFLLLLIIGFMFEWKEGILSLNT